MMSFFTKAAYDLYMSLHAYMFKQIAMETILAFKIHAVKPDCKKFRGLLPYD